MGLKWTPPAQAQDFLILSTHICTEKAIDTVEPIDGVESNVEKLVTDRVASCLSSGPSFGYEAQDVSSNFHQEDGDDIEEAHSLGPYEGCRNPTISRIVPNGDQNNDIISTGVVSEVNDNVSESNMGSRTDSSSRDKNIHEKCCLEDTVANGTDIEASTSSTELTNSFPHIGKDNSLKTVERTTCEERSFGEVCTDREVSRLSTGCEDHDLSLDFHQEDGGDIEIL